MFKFDLIEPGIATALANLARVVRGLERNNLIYTLERMPNNLPCQFRIWSTGPYEAEKCDERGFGGSWHYNDNPWLLAVITGPNKETVEDGCKIFWHGRTQRAIQGTRGDSWIWK